jgi:hypothetical protein
MFRENVLPPSSGWKRKKPIEAGGELNYTSVADRFCHLLLISCMAYSSNSKMMFLGNVGLPSTYTELQARRPFPVLPLSREVSQFVPVAILTRASLPKYSFDPFA